MRFSLVGCLFLVSLGVFARPTPKDGVDEALLAKIAERRGDSACRSDLLRTRELLAREQATLRQWVLEKQPEGKLDTQEAKVEDFRKRFRKVSDKCGDCMTNTVVLKKEPSPPGTPPRTENWIMSDGSCQLDLEDSAAFQAAYEAMSRSLATTADYPVYRGGFSNVLEYLPFDEQTGQTLPDLETLQSPYFAFIAIKGPDYVLLKQSAFSYALRGETTQKSGETVARFSSVTPPGGFIRPKVYLHPARARGYGPEKDVEVLQNDKVWPYTVVGGWYLNANGVVRYQTSGDFNLAIPASFEDARQILLQTIIEMSDRGLTATKEPS